VSEKFFVAKKLRKKRRGSVVILENNLKKARSRQASYLLNTKYQILNTKYQIPDT
jgi:hypothetical protein